MERGLGFLEGAEQGKKGVSPQVSAPKALLLGSPGLVLPTDTSSHYRGGLGPVILAPYKLVT